MDKFSAIEQAWLDHAYDGFPRKHCLHQKLIHSQEDYLRYNWSMQGRTNIYTALFSEPTKESETYFRMYFDVDNENDIYGAFIDTMEIRKWFLDNINIEPTIYFSGKKGFAIYFYFKPRRFEEYQYTCRAIVDDIKQDIGQTFVGETLSIDDSVVGDTSRISRVPYTKHMGSHRYCIPVNNLIGSSNYYTFNKIIKFSYKYELIPSIAINIATGVDDWLKEYEEKGKAKKEELAEKLGNGRDYGWNLDQIMDLSPRLIGGRRCLMYRVIIPKMWQEGYSYHEILKYVKQFIKRSGSPIGNIERLVKRHLEYTKIGKSVMWSQQAFFDHEPWAYGIFNGGN